MWRNWVMAGVLVSFFGLYSWTVLVPNRRTAEPNTTVRERYLRDRKYRTRDVFTTNIEDPLSPSAEAEVRRASVVAAAKARESDRVSSTPKVSSGGYSSGRSYGGIGSGK